MIIYTNENILLSPAQTLVNTVNTTGVMGKGLAKAFKLYYPNMFKKYYILCHSGNFNIGQLMLYKPELNSDLLKRYVLNFPTKSDWRQPSKLSYVEDGLKKFTDKYQELGIKSVAFPLLGAGLGGLDWSTVKAIMEKYLKNINIPVYIHTYRSKKQTDKIDKKIIHNLKTSSDAWQNNSNINWSTFLETNHVNCDGIILPNSQVYQENDTITHAKFLTLSSNPNKRLIWIQEDTSIQ